MQTITDNLLKSIDRPTPIYKKTIELYRQLWSGTAYAHADAVDITDYLTDDSEGRIMWKLDNEDYGVFNLDNVTLTFKNEHNQWKQDNTKGLFPSGYLINQSKIVIKIGAQLADGTYETLNSFTGFISGDPAYNPEEKKVSMTLVSAMSIFDKKSAEEISTLVTDELLGEDSGTVFTTANVGVGVLIIVKRGTTLAGAVEIKPTTDYTPTDLNSKDDPLTITLVTDLTAGQKLYISYRYWYQGKSLEWLAEQVMTLCGIDSYAITPVVFAEDVENIVDYNSKADWDTFDKDAGVHITAAGSVKFFTIDDFSEGDYPVYPAWQGPGPGGAELGGVAQGGIEDDKLKLSGVAGHPSTKTTGSWLFKMYSNAPGGIPPVGQSAGIRFDQYHWLILEPAGMRFRLGSTDPILSLPGLYPTSSDIFRITRTAGGTVTLYMNEIQKAQFTDAYDYAINFMLVGQGDSIYFDSISEWDGFDASASETLVSPVIDTANSAPTWGDITPSVNLNGGTVLIETYSSSSADFSTGNDAAGWVALSETGFILSASKRYLKIRITGTILYTSDPPTPVLDRMIIKYYTTAISIELVNLTDMSCRDVLNKLSEMAAYEMGFKADNTFIFRPRSTSMSAVLDLTSTANIKSVASISDGVDRVYNRVIAEFGLYKKMSDSSADDEPSSITKYGTREYSVSTSNLLPAANVNLAYAVAPSILAYTKTPRRRCTVETKFILHLELGDKVTVYYDEPTALRQWKYGDMDVVYGQADLEYYDASVLNNRLNLWGTSMRVEGVEFDFQNWTTIFDLVEVL